MESKCTLFMLLLHVPGPIVYNSSLHVILKKKMFVVVILSSIYLPLKVFLYPVPSPSYWVMFPNSQIAI